MSAAEDYSLSPLAMDLLDRLAAAGGYLPNQYAHYTPVLTAALTANGLGPETWSDPADFEDTVHQEWCSVVWELTDHGLATAQGGKAEGLALLPRACWGQEGWTR